MLIHGGADMRSNIVVFLALVASGFIGWNVRTLWRQHYRLTRYQPVEVRILGKRLDHGRSARAPLRLFIRQGSSFTDAQVHETVELPPGKVGTMKGRLLHFTHRDFGHALYKNADYAWLGAKKRYASGKAGMGLTGAAIRALWTFIQIYFIRLGFLDGRVGFLVAVMYSQGNFNKYAGLWTLKRQADQKLQKEMSENH